MRLFPYKEYIIETDMQKNTALDRLTKLTANKNIFSLPNKDKLFIGEVNENGFDLILHMFSLYYPRRYNRPVIKGVINQEDGVTKIEFSVETSGITKFMPFLVIAFLLVEGIKSHMSVETLLTFFGSFAFLLLLYLGIIYAGFSRYRIRCLSCMEIVFREYDSEHYITYETKNKKYETTEDSI